MTRSVEHIDTSPEVIPARVNIHHLQLRDLLQPTGTKDKVLFVSRLQVEQADFSSSLKPPSVYCSLDFQPNCLTVGCGLLAAGGQHGELALRPLQSAISDSISGERVPAPWLLRTPTGGSINNAITIQHDLNHPFSSHSHPSVYSGSAAAGPSKADIMDDSPTDNYTLWSRDEPSSSSSNVARPGLLFGDEEMESELSQSVFEELAAAYGFDPASVNRSSRFRRSPSRPHRASAPTSEPQPLPTAPIKVMVSNNDQSIKLYKLRPPKSQPGANNRIESGLPGLSRNTTLHFPTAINHSSLSPDQRTLVAVGDTPDVFLHTVSRSGEHTKIATYSASSDACFSTTWSPDGSKFAVASQDGIVSVWDVRSSRRLAVVSTSQAALASGSGAARVVKFSPDGRYLAFTEHRNFWGVTDTVGFEETQRIPAPMPGEGEGRRIALSGSSMLNTERERFRLVTGGEDAIARDRDRRNMIHATFMREWNRAINLVDRGPRSLTTDDSASSTRSNTSSGFGRGSNYFPDLLTNSTSTTSADRRREDLLTAALSQTVSGYRPSSSISSAGSGGSSAGEGHSINISGLCWDPDSEAVYVSTERCVAKYNVRDTRVSVPRGDWL